MNLTVSPTPTFHTFAEIFHDMIETWYNCEAWAISRVEVQLIFFVCFVLTVIYVYVMVIIVRFISKLHSFRNPFYYCAIVLAVGDIVSLITSSREGPIQTCVLRNIPERHIAWESIGAFSVDLIYSVNLVMAIVRLNAMIGISKNESTKNYTLIMNGLIFIAVLWSIFTSMCYYSGLVKTIWFTGDKYNSQFLSPFDILRTPIQLAQLGSTFLIYVVAFFQLREIKVTRSISHFRREYRFLLLAVLIFLCELVYYYCTDWVGSLILHIGSDEFNARLNYFLRPITTGMTPMFYLVFSIDLRYACLRPFSHRHTSRVYPNSTTLRKRSTEPQNT